MNKRSLPEPLGLSHQGLLEPRLRQFGDGLSEYCFSNLYLFRQSHDYHVVDDDFTCVGGRTYDGCYGLMPLFDLAEPAHMQLLSLVEGYDFFYPISEKQVEKLDLERFELMSNRDDSDYLYAAESLATYRGQRLKPKRNLMNQFLSLGNKRIEELGSEHVEDALEILEQWQVDKKKKYEETDFYSCREALQHLEVLELIGLMVYVADEPAGFLLAKEVSPGICAIHFAKGKASFVGVFQYMFNCFATLWDKKYSYYNFEQDLGLKNLRKTKLSYCPERLLKKYRVRPI